MPPAGRRLRRPGRSRSPRPDGKACATGQRWAGKRVNLGQGGQEMGKRTGFAHLAPALTRLGACLKITRGAAAGDFDSNQGGEVGPSPQWAVTTEPTQAKGKRPAAQRVFVEKAVWLRCSSVEDPRGIFSFVAPRHPAFSTKTSPLVIFKQALRPDDSTQVVDFPHKATVRLIWEQGFYRRDAETQSRELTANHANQFTELLSRGWRISRSPSPLAFWWRFSKTERSLMFA
jgi:hypothetical protein